MYSTCAGLSRVSTRPPPPIFDDPMVRWKASYFSDLHAILWLDSSQHGASILRMPLVVNATVY